MRLLRMQVCKEIAQAINLINEFIQFLGIPYADSFSVMLHYCMKRTVDDSTVLSVHAHIKYKKVSIRPSNQAQRVCV